MRVKLLPTAMTLIALLGNSGAFAASATAPMQVSVQVIARAVVTVDSQPDYVAVTTGDIERGYVDVETPIQLRVRTNSRAGYVLQVDKSSALFPAIELAFGSSTMTVSDHESWISRPYIAGGDTLSIHARVRLSPDVQPGSYSLPVSITARPL